MIDKILPQKELAELVQSFHEEGKKVVFTNGCFDLLHVGHVRYLEEAKELGDILIIGINSDASVKKIKGEGRPVIPEQERAEVLAALGCVDFVTIFEEETPNQLLLLLQPDWHVKGGDYKASELPETKTVISYGGKVKILSYSPGRSTTILLEKLTHGNCSNRKQSG
ncbi:MAG: D-glycero-beta-D-manno-heptose 1-phosphate adenylyltransferase [Firmicutes bacterium]|jgi:rfaE bifunctional protein nucleotidyltransferase chain/domain|nr:D-glycero-beta-D-manno-heptose 1-phosphate adenylyltransferase [Bacillota bacterium]